MSNEYIIRHSPTALLLIRVSLEHGSALPLRAYIRQTADVSRGFEAASTEADIESVLASVRIWLEALLDADSAGAPPGVSPNNPLSAHGLATEGIDHGLPDESSASTNGGHPGH